MPGPSKRQLILVSVAAVPCVIVVTLWAARAPLGVWAATDYLRKKGVPAKIRIDRLSTTGFVGAVTAGPADDPDLVIDHIEADYALFPDNRFAPRIGAVRLSGVRLKAAFDGKALRLGALQPLVDEALAAPPSGGAGPKVQFDGATVRLATPAGAVVLTGQGLIDDGRVQRLIAGFAAPRLAHGELLAADVRGALTVTGGEHLTGRLTLTADAAQTMQAQGKGLNLRADVAIPYGRDPAKLLDGVATVAATLQAASLSGGGWTATQAAARLGLTGRTAGGVGDASYDGRIALAAQSQKAAGAGAVLDRPSLTASSDQARLSTDAKAVAASAPLLIKVAAEAGHMDLGGRMLRLGDASFSASGPAGLGAEGLTADFSGGGRAHGSFAAKDAIALADQIAAPGALPDVNAAMRRALPSWTLTAPRLRATAEGGAFVVRAPQPARVDFSKGSVVLAAASNAPLAAAGPSGTSGAARLTLAGEGLPGLDLAVSRYRLTPSGASASARLGVKGDLAPIEGLDSAADLTLASSGRTTSVRMSGCTPLTATMMKAGPDPLLSGVKAALCPAAAPLLSLDARGWRVAAKLQDAAFGLPAAQAEATGAAVTIALGANGAGRPGGTFDVSGVRLTDTPLDKATPVRFAPLSLSGRFTLAGNTVAGRLDAALAAKAGTLASLDVTHDLPAGEGRATLAPTRVAFTKGALQPADIAPGVDPFVSQVTGAVEVGGDFTWGKAGVTGSARAGLQGLDFNAAGGKVSGLKGTVDFPTLLPAIVTAPDQHLTAARFETVLPITDIDLRFALAADALNIASVRAGLAKGSVSLDPLVLPLVPGKSTASALHATNVDIDEVIAALNLADSVTMQARIEANLPFSLTPEGLRFANGRIAAMAPGRLSIKRSALAGVASGGAATAQASAPGAPPVSAPATNAVQDFAYQALENMAFDSLDATVDSRPQGRLGVVFHVKGRNDPPKDLPARVGVIDLIRGTAFDKPINLPKGTPVDLTLDTSLNFDDLMAAYGQASRSGGVQP